MHLIPPQKQTQRGIAAHPPRVLQLAPFIKRKKGAVQLVFTSPPYPLNRKKKYGNLSGQEYVDWLVGVISQCKALLTEDGSIAIEIGNAWEAGRPVMSTLVLKTLLAIQEQLGLYLCQEFIIHNPARIPSPAQWVNIERIRVKDSFTRVWWLSPVERPKADNRNVLQEYSKSMKKLLSTGKYNSGVRPSQHDISEKSFLKNNGGAIPPNVLIIANTSSSDPYQKYCKQNDIELHPARMPRYLAEFFINFLTDPGDIPKGVNNEYYCLLFIIHFHMITPCKNQIKKSSLLPPSNDFRIMASEKQPWRSLPPIVI